MRNLFYTTWIRTLQFATFLLCGSLLCACAMPGQVAPVSEISGSDVVTIVNSCGILDDIRFVGRVVYRADDGSLVPVRDVSFERHGQEGFLTSDTSAKPVHVNRKGEFEFPVLVGVEGVAGKGGGKAQEREVTEQVSFTLRAAGCEDLQVPFQPGQPAVTLEMNCPIRALGKESSEAH